MRRNVIGTGGRAAATQADAHPTAHGVDHAEPATATPDTDAAIRTATIATQLGIVPENAAIRTDVAVDVGSAQQIAAAAETVTLPAPPAVQQLQSPRPQLADEILMRLKRTVAETAIVHDASENELVASIRGILCGSPREEHIDYIISHMDDVYTTDLGDSNAEGDGTSGVVVRPPTDNDSVRAALRAIVSRCHGEHQSDAAMQQP